MRTILARLTRALFFYDMLAQPQNVLCNECRHEVATVVDHKKAHKGDYDLFWDQSNHQGLCKHCHGRKTASEDGGFGNR